MNYLTLILATFFWGGNFNVAKLVVRYLPTFTSAAVRFSIASVVVIGVFLATERFDAAVIRRNFFWYVVLGLIGVFGFNVLFFLGLKYTSPVNGSLIMATNPLITVLLSSLLLQEKLRGVQKLGLLLSAIGIAFVITGGSWMMIRTMSVSIGDGFVLLACACWAAYGVLSRRYLVDSPPMTTTAVTMVIGTIAMIPFAAAETQTVALRALPAL